MEEGEDIYTQWGSRRKKFKSKRLLSPSPSSSGQINNFDDGTLMHIFSFLSPIPDRYNTALVCHRWRYLACHLRLWLRVNRDAKDSSENRVFPSVEMAVSAARLEEVSFRMKQHFCVLGVQTVHWSSFPPANWPT